MTHAFRTSPEHLWNYCTKQQAARFAEHGFQTTTRSRAVRENDRMLNARLVKSIGHSIRNLPGRTRKSDLPKDRQEQFFKCPNPDD